MDRSRDPHQPSARPSYLHIISPLSTSLLLLHLPALHSAPIPTQAILRHHGTRNIHRPCAPPTATPVAPPLPDCSASAHSSISRCTTHNRHSIRIVIIVTLRASTQYSSRCHQRISWVAAGTNTPAHRIGARMPRQTTLLIAASNDEHGASIEQRAYGSTG